MKLFRVGTVILAIGMSLLVATYLRVQRGTPGSGNPFGVFGPFVFEPKETTIVLREVNPQNATLFVVNAQSWSSPENLTELTAQDISKIEPVFTATGLGNLDAVTFKIQWRGRYYIVIATSTGEPVDDAEITFEQRGIPEDFLWISIILSGTGVVIIVIHKLKTSTRHD